ncbi:unnamed protein product, partial [Mesorhabditis belari]|uniref:Nucleosome assembly protein 1-like 1 n=1 Tax=Mesorhabditis belari TaxID=2138241 RepID=A0AAF3FF72_9BILA
MPANGDLSQLLQMDSDPCGEFLKELPKDIKRRVCALKKLQLQSLEVESEFYQRVHQLEKEFESKFNKLYDLRRKVVTGEKEPTDEEANIPLLHDATPEELAALDETAPETSGEKGVPNFWSHVFENCETISDMIQEHDKDILKYLIDVTTTVETSPEEGFSLAFHFTANPYFKNSVLTKRYFLQMKPEEDNPFEFDGPSVIRTTGDQIQWEDNKDVTKKVIKKKSKKGANAGKFLTKTVKADSFFNFFDPPVCDHDHQNEDDDDDLEEHELLRADFALGQLLRDIVVPRAVLLYTGEQTEDDYLDDGGDFEDDDDMEDEDDD